MSDSVLLEYFDKIYCVNLERRVDRWEKVKLEFDRFNLKPERYLAVDGINYDWSKVNVNPTLLKGELGLVETHINIIQDAKLNDYRRILIFEDDVIFSEEFRNVENYLEKVPHDWDMLYLSGNHRNGKPPKKINDKVLDLNHTLTTHCIAINQSIYDDILNLITVRDKQIDVYYSEIQKKFNVYGFYPNIIFQDYGFSDIQDKNVNYNDVLLTRYFKLFDNNFPHNEFTTAYQKTYTVRWDRSYLNTNEYDTIVITDDCMLSSQEVGKGRKIGMLMEPRGINPMIYYLMSQEVNYQNFDKILTYDKELLNVSNKFEFYPHCGCWIQPQFQKVFIKSKLVSIIASNKNYTIGHKLRHEAIEMAKAKNLKLDLFGNLYSPIEHKIEALGDYRFSIVIENCKLDYYFTEKLIDSFITGTVPIYWGCPSIGKFFNLDGMIIFNDVNELEEILNSLTVDKYNSMLKAVNENFEEAKHYLMVENWLYKTNNDIFK